MSPFYRRTTPGVRENLVAALVAAGTAVGVASVSFYLVRTFLAREAMEPRAPSSGQKGAGPGPGKPVSRHPGEEG